MLVQSRSKRQCRGFDHISDKNPATAALEAALSMDDTIAFDSTVDSSDLLQISLLSAWASEASLFHFDYLPCTKQMPKSIISSVNTVDNVASILSKLTTAPTAA